MKLNILISYLSLVYCLQEVKEKAPGCYKSASSLTPIDKCKCDPICKTCGYGEAPTKYTDCLSCSDPK